MNDRLLTKGFVLSILLFFTVVFFLYLSRDILAPFVVAVFLTYLLAPLVGKIMFLGLRRWVAVAILTAVMCVVMFFTISFIFPLIIDDINIFLGKIPEYVSYAKNFSSEIYDRFERFIPFIKKYNLFDEITAKSANMITGAVSKIPKYLMSIFSAVSIVVLVPVITFFMLLEYKKLINSVIALLPSKYIETAISILYETDSVMGKYVRGQIIEVFFVGAFSIIGLIILGVNYAFLIGTFAGLCNLIPYLGPAVGFITAAVIAGIQFKSLVAIIEVAVLFLVLQQLDNNIVQPLVIGKNVNLSPVMMMFSLLAGAEIFGFLGILLAIPAAALLKNIFIMFVKRYKKIHTV